MSSVAFHTGEPLPVPGGLQAPRRAAARRHRRGFWNGWWWEWLAASAVAYPGGGIVHLMTTLDEE